MHYLIYFALNVTYRLLGKVAGVPWDRGSGQQGVGASGGRPLVQLVVDRELEGSPCHQEVAGTRLLLHLTACTRGAPQAYDCYYSWWFDLLAFEREFLCE